VTRFEYYEALKALARQVRAENGLTTPRVLRSDLRRIYKKERIKIDLKPGFKNLRGAYFNDECGTSVVIAKGLPPDPTVFTMAHELKHHLKDRDTPDFQCGFAEGTTDHIEVGAEIFAAELIFPESDFRELLAKMGVQQNGCTAEHLVHLKHETRTTLSYQGMAKRAEFMKLAPSGCFAKVKFTKLEEQMYGKPFRRSRKAALP
jgi:Zn-dependent peptidase ImmA (M78 family)